MIRQTGYPLRPLRDFIARFEVGVSVNAEDRPAIEGEHGVLKVSAVGLGMFRPEEQKAVLPGEFGRLGPSLRAGDVLVTRANTLELVGAAAVVDRDYPYLHLSDKTWRVVHHDVNAATRTWLPFALNSIWVRSALRSRATGSSGSMKNVGQDAYLGIEIPVPPLTERGPIGQALQLLDRDRRTAAALIVATRKRRLGLMQHLLTGPNRLPGFAQGTWKEWRLGELFDERLETGRDDLPLLSITADRGLIQRDAVDRKDTSNADKRAYLRIVPGDIGYNTMRMWQGVSALAALEGIVSPAYTVCVPKPAVDGRFASYLFKLPAIVQRFRRFSQGLVDDTLNLKFHHFAQIRLHLPPLDEQRAIGDILAALDREIDLLERQRELCDVQRMSVSRILLSGEARTPYRRFAEAVPA